MGEMGKRREKYKKKTTKKDEGKYLIPFDLSALNLFCSYVLSENQNIKKSHYINMRNLFNVIHLDSFKNDEEKLKRVDFIKKGLEARVKHNFTNTYLVMKYINGGFVETDILDPKNISEISNEELDWINNTISSCVKNSYMDSYVYEMEEFFIKYRSTDYIDRGLLVQDFEKIVNTIQNKFRKVRAEKSSDAMFSLEEGVFENCITDVYNQFSNPSNMLKTGMQGFNEMLSGGFRSSSVYLLFGLPGEGKTTTMANLAYQIKMFNKDFKTKDPTKKPCIIFLSNENTLAQLVETFYNISTTPESMTNKPLEEVIRSLREEGSLVVSDEDPINIIIKYEPGGSIDTSYLYTISDDLEDEGYEVICVIQDYIKRIRPVDKTGELRIDLGNVINDFRNFAAYKGIPVISASQLNRDATKHIDEGRKARKSDLVRMLGRSNIGESMIILENIDGGFMITPEFDQEGNKFLGIERIKARYKKISNREHLFQPYVDGNSVRLEADAHLSIPVFKESMRVNIEDYNTHFQNKTNVTSYMSNDIKHLDDVKLLNSDESNIFINSANRYIETQVAYHNPYMQQQPHIEKKWYNPIKKLHTKKE